MKEKRMFIAIFTAMVILTGPLAGRGADRTEKLIEILIKKGIITKEEVESLQKEIKTEEESKPIEKMVRPEATPKEDWTRKFELGYKNGAYIKTVDDRFFLKLNVNFQGLFNYDWLEGEDKTTFRVRRARLITSGNAFYPWLKYYAQITLEDNVNLRDAYIEATYLKWLTPKLGQYKVPFDREFLTSAFNLQLIDRSIANNEFSLQRDVGL